MSKRKAELRKLLYSMAKYDSARSNSYLTACQENSTDVSKKRGTKSTSNKTISNLYC